MKDIVTIIPEKQDGTPITLSIPKMTKLDKLAKFLLGTGIGLAIGGAISTLLGSGEEKPQTETSDEDAQ